MANSLHIESALNQALKSCMHAQYGCIMFNSKTHEIVSVGYNKTKGTQSSDIKECPLRPL
jgi:deoxycytidylate deaminase